MIIKWSVEIDKDPLDEVGHKTHNCSQQDFPINITNPIFIKEQASNMEDDANLERNYCELPIADHRSNGFVNNPRLLHENRYYPMDPMHCWTHSPKSRYDLAYCSMFINEQDDPLLYKIIKHGMKYLQRKYEISSEQEESFNRSVIKYSNSNSLIAPEIDINWNYNLNNENFFDLGDLLIVACGEVVVTNGANNEIGKDIKNVEIYVSKINLKDNEEHFIRFLQNEDIIFSGLEWEFHAYNFTIGPFTSLEICERYRRKTKRDTGEWLDLEFETIDFDSEIFGSGSDNTTDVLNPYQLLPFENEIETLLLPPMELFSVDSASQISTATGYCFSRRVSYSDTQQTTPEKGYV